ncbi:thiamine pyrophosphate-dependent dehydrogenase E1 component subunit alpha [Alphaproteobacteria bacterium]|nr:thiamine pyrophosphate-dependent dehydrogenase E1 component subunit alpha [Alphaproteobacteria bacterium]
MSSKIDNNELLESCLRIRLIEEKIVKEYYTDVIQSPVHLSIGQEAVAVGLVKALKKKDTLFINYRGHAYYLARNGALFPFFAELCGKQAGISKGKAGSMHLSSASENIIGASAVVGTSISNAVGFALGSRYKKDKDITVVVFGDGATEQGTFHESLNFAALYNVPILFLCEDNGLAVHSNLRERHAYDHEKFAKSYGIECNSLYNATDPSEVFNFCNIAINKIRENNKPQFVTIQTKRYYSHVGVGLDFDAGYRDENEIINWKKNDPVITYMKTINHLETIKEEINIEFENAVKSSASLQSEILTDVY